MGTVLVLPPSSGDSDKPGCDLLCHTLGLVPGPTLSSGAGEVSTRPSNTCKKSISCLQLLREGQQAFPARFAEQGW